MTRVLCCVSLLVLLLSALVICLGLGLSASLPARTKGPSPVAGSATAKAVSRPAVGGAEAPLINGNGLYLKHIRTYDEPGERVFLLDARVECPRDSLGTFHDFQLTTNLGTARLEKVQFRSWSNTTGEMRLEVRCGKKYDGDCEADYLDIVSATAIPTLRYDRPEVLARCDLTPLLRRDERGEMIVKTSRGPLPSPRSRWALDKRPPTRLVHDGAAFIDEKGELQRQRYMATRPEALPTLQKRPEIRVAYESWYGKDDGSTVLRLTAPPGMETFYHYIRVATNVGERALFSDDLVPGSWELTLDFSNLVWYREPDARRFISRTFYSRDMSKAKEIVIYRAVGYTRMSTAEDETEDTLELDILPDLVRDPFTPLPILLRGAPLPRGPNGRW